MLRVRVESRELREESESEISYALNNKTYLQNANMHLLQIRLSILQINLSIFANSS